MGLTEADPRWGVFDGTLTKEYEETGYDVVGEFKHIHITMTTRILEDGAEISSSYFIKVLQPHEDISGESDEIKAVANAMWTDKIKADWNLNRNL